MTPEQPPPPAHDNPSHPRLTPPPGAVAYTPTGQPDLSATHPDAISPSHSLHPTRALLTRPLPGFTTPAYAPRRPIRRTTTVIAAVGVLTLIIVSTVLILATNTPPPDTQVRALFTALTNHDGPALQNLDVCHDSPLCDQDALASGYQPPQHVRLDAAQPDNDDHDTITVHYDIDNTNDTDHVGVTRYRHGLLGHEWRITEPPGADLHISSTYWHQAHIAGIDIDTTTNLKTNAAPSPFWAPPGRYTITTTSDPIVDPAHLDLTITDNHQPPPITLTPTIKADLTLQADQQIHTRIDQCAAQPRSNPNVGTSPLDFDSCPFSYDIPYTVVDHLHWTVDQYPTIALHVQDDGTITVATTTPGQATLTYQWTLDIVTPQHWTTASTTMPITIGGHIEVDNGTAVWKT